MISFSDQLSCFLQFSLSVLPEVRKQVKSLAAAQKNCVFKNCHKSSDPETAMQYFPNTTILCSSFFALYPGIDRTGSLSFILSLYILADRLNSHRSSSDITDDAEIRRLYSCLLCAVDPSRSTACILTESCLSGICRAELTSLPSLCVVAPKLKKYMEFYIGLQSYKYDPSKNKYKLLEAWSNAYMKRYQGLYWWEFCAASDSFIGIASMFAAASNPDLTQEEIRLLDEACFPWLSGLDRLLSSYISSRLADQYGYIHYASNYKNLKVFEERILFFAKKAEDACSRLKESSFHLALIRMLIGMYLSEPEASFGMHRLASSNILKEEPGQTMLYRMIYKLLHLYSKHSDARAAYTS